MHALAALLSAVQHVRPHVGKACPKVALPTLGTLGERARGLATLTAAAPDFGTPPWLIQSPVSRPWISADAIPAAF